MPKRILQGRSSSATGNKTVVVRVERRVMDPVYKKFVRRSKNYAAHDEDNRCHVGDAVQIEECRPISKRKSWVVLGAASGVAPGGPPPCPRRRGRGGAEVTANEAGGAA